MSEIEAKRAILGGGIDPTGNFSISNNGPAIEVERGKVGGGVEVATRIRPDGGVEFPLAPALPVKPEDAVIARVLAAMMPKVIPVMPGKRSFVKKGARAISIKAGTVIFVGGIPKSYSADTAVVMPDVLTPGEDYSIWALPSGALFAAKDGFDAPYAPIPAQAGAVKLGGFHFGLVGVSETLVGGSFNTTEKASKDMVWKQSDLDLLAGINAHSIWDEAFQPECDPRGMTCVTTSAGEGLFWFDIYFTGTEHITNGTSRAGTDVASGTVPPKIPAMFGGNGTTKYTTFNWIEAVTEVAQSHGKRAMQFSEFGAAAFGVTEKQAIGGATTTIPLTKREAGYTSKWGGEQMAGNQHVFGQEISSAGGSSWLDTRLRGNGYGNIHVVIYGGSRDVGVNAGSQCSNCALVSTSSNWFTSARFACNHKRPQ